MFVKKNDSEVTFFFVLVMSISSILQNTKEQFGPVTHETITLW